ncbi:MAG: acyl-CoA dehydrogenase family protein, partial [Gammaproteobacteria bacterium]|nr:acyl-CoA dehydrogenase family protein [Gammaproteobacteria bacterium]
PGVASSDASNISTTGIERDGNWVINGEKTYITGAGDPRCAVMIVMVLTDPDAPKRQRHSQILVPTDTPGVEIVRPMQVFGTDDAPSGHMHLRFSDATVPLDHVIAGRGRGFEISQGRLGPGRVHHCMRAIGLAEKALDLMCRRGLERTAFRKPIAWLGGNPERIARARIDIDMARLLTLRTAWEIDNNGLDVARVWISKIKATVPAVVTRVIDDAIQLHGAAGLSQDTELATMYMAARALRIVDGPDEVHAMVVARDTLNPYR